MNEFTETRNSTLVSNKAGIRPLKDLKVNHVNPRINSNERNFSGTTLIPKIAMKGLRKIGYNGPCVPGNVKRYKKSAALVIYAESSPDILILMSKRRRPDKRVIVIEAQKILSI